MSWDLYVQDWGNYETLSEIPDDFIPQPIGRRQAIIDRIQQVEPTVDFSDPSWGKLENDRFSIEFNMGKTEELYSFAMHVRGSTLAVACIGNILSHLGLRAADGKDDQFFNTKEAGEKMAAWLSYRNSILEP